ncbi:sporulation protein Cse60 [Fervidibacillus halotolerans]|uniref:Sporulation protein Cse60 n=1 Tax=Fervidibacillus halotolerans TaxID=2980027 RepID=A0A9E8LXX0_9BACI|nr:sporulation protein Cse60 [Fervidibacillus halotolerans]WAA11768.1 sporulation protein Cse60 [Fervidibacillus halotolerans]
MIQVKIFDYEHEKDLEEEMNRFLTKIDEDRFIDLQYDVEVQIDANGEQIYCFSAMIIYLT